MSSRTYAHRPGSPNLRLHIITYGSSNGHPNIALPVLLHLDLSRMQPPPRQILRHLTGLSSEVAQAFFAIPGHEARYRSWLSNLEHRLLSMLSDPSRWRSRPGQDGSVAVLVNCTAGRHRSVAVAERLARDLERRRWGEVSVRVEHMELRRARVGSSGGRDSGVWGPEDLARCRCELCEMGVAYRARHVAGR